MSKKVKRFREQQARIVALADRWLRPLGLLWWDVEICYYDSHKEWRKGHRRNAVMTTFADWRYRRARIDVCVPHLKAFSDQEVEHFFVHECMHILVCEMRQHGDDQGDHEERVCESLAQAAQWIKQATFS